MGDVTLRDTPPFRAEHVGSLLRPPEVPEAGRPSRPGACPPPTDAV